MTRCDFTIWSTFCAVRFFGLILLWIMFCLYRGISHCETFLLCKKEDYSCLLGKTSKANKLYSSDWCRIWVIPRVDMDAQQNVGKYKRIQTTTCWRLPAIQLNWVLDWIIQIHICEADQPGNVKSVWAHVIRKVTVWSLHHERVSVLMRMCRAQLCRTLLHACVSQSLLCVSPLFYTGTVF